MSSHRQVSKALTGAAAVALLTASAGCGVTGRAVATWQPAPGQVLEGDTTSFTALVTRLGCNGGETGEVEDPRIDEGDDEVTVTFTVTPGEPAAADCQGNEAVPHDVQLPGALGGRTLIDGACASAEADGTAPCIPGATRPPT